mmetsp:Transcript_29992/g.90166  ORF Transcript_29992/g.90166 Transcript_29992/m.90166 type:complete len:508 (+) Transcript_29992:310-1833(+)
MGQRLSLTRMAQPPTASAASSDAAPSATVPSAADAAPSAPDATTTLTEAGRAWNSSFETAFDPMRFLKLRPDLRTAVLEFIVSASDGSLRAMRRNKIDENGRERVPQSAAASLRTLTFHTRSIKAVCSVVRADMQLLELTIASPRRWLENLWLITEPEDDLALAQCRRRATTALRANLLRVQLSQYGTACDAKPEVVAKVPASWDERRKNVVKNVRDAKLEDGSALNKCSDTFKREAELFWARMQVRSPDEVAGASPVDHKFLNSQIDNTWRGFGELVQNTKWTLLVSKVQLVYRGRQLDGAWTDATTEAYDALDAGLVDYFGADTLRAAPWIQAWTNAYPAPFHWSETYHQECRNFRQEYVEAKWHDPDRPPVTRIRDINKFGERCRLMNLTENSDWVNLKFLKRPILSAATIDLELAGDLVNHSGPQAMGEGWTKYPSYYFLCDGDDSAGTVRCRTGTKAVDKCKFKLRTTSVSKAAHLDQAVVFVPIVAGVFDVTLQCSVVGLN